MRRFSPPEREGIGGKRRVVGGGEAKKRNQDQENENEKECLNVDKTQSNWPLNKMVLLTQAIPRAVPDLQ